MSSDLPKDSMTPTPGGVFHDISIYDYFLTWATRLQMASGQPAVLCIAPDQLLLACHPHALQHPRYTSGLVIGQNTSICHLVAARPSRWQGMQNSLALQLSISNHASCCDQESFESSLSSQR